jgi:hypothetical protein
MRRGYLILSSAVNRKSRVCERCFGNFACLQAATEADGPIRPEWVDTGNWPATGNTRPRPVIKGLELTVGKRTFSGCVRMVSMNFSVNSARGFGPFRVWRTCPNCQQQIDIELALRLSSWSNLAPSNYGIRCPTCKMVLAAHQRAGSAAFWVVFAIVFAFIFLGIKTNQLTRIGVLPIVVGMGIFALLMNRWKLRSLIELTVPPPTTPTSKARMGASKSYGLIPP